MEGIYNAWDKMLERTLDDGEQALRVSGPEHLAIVEKTVSDQLKKLMEIAVKQVRILTTVESEIKIIRAGWVSRADLVKMLLEDL